MKAAIFDMDGTLLDSMEMWYNVGYTFLNQRNIPIPEGLGKAVEHLKMSDAAEYIADNFPLNMTGSEVLAAWLHIIDEGYATTVTLKPYVMEYLDKLRADGVKMCIATLTDRAQALPALKKHHLLDYFEFVLTVREVGKNKTHPDIFLQCAERLGALVSESTVFEDSLYASKTAKNAGFEVCAVYDITNKSDKQNLVELCGTYIHSFLELL